ncbi:MAG TPA: pyridoxal-phosphate dependent enzyme [Sphingobacteriaceae bacterium]|nr:pyridoxal-phosphate dependent enzyme [Sphingobacteriaceae bacterium]
MEIYKEIIALDINSPVQELYDPLFTKKHVTVFIKRDDLIHPFISGNKWRKLKYTLIRAREMRKNHLVTFGGAYSNHLVATACAAARFGFNATGFVRGEPVDNHSMMLCGIFGMELIFTDRESYRNKNTLFDQYYTNDDDAYFIDEGGAGEKAVKGCMELIAELDKPFDHIFCAAGTGTTAAGLLKGLEQIGSPAYFHAISSLKNGSFLKEEIGKYNINTQNLILHCNYHFGGYAKSTPELLNFIKMFASSTGILLDQVYTGKAAYALYDLIANDHFHPGDKLLLIHSGGLLGLLSQAEKFISS